MIINSDYYNYDYYERGIETNKSCYSNYRWMPEQTMSMAMTIIDYLDIKPRQTILDYGCGKGFLVKAFNLLHRYAWGVDISRYAIENVDPQVKNRCYLNMDELYTNQFEGRFDFCIAKDVFEHIPIPDLEITLNQINANKMLVIVPLGDDGKYRAPANNLDSSHVICEDECWWLEQLQMSGWTTQEWTFKIPGIKESYYKKYPEAHGFFFVKKKRK